MAPALGDRVLAAMVTGFSEVAQISLREPSPASQGVVPVPAPPYQGAFLPIDLGLRHALVGIVSTPEGCTQLARGYMQVSGTIRDIDVADAVGELVNITAGIIKRELLDMEPAIHLGLPTFTRDGLMPPLGASTFCAAMQVGKAPVKLVVYLGA